MNELKNKVFFTVLSIFTLFIVGFIIIYNVQEYLKYKNLIINNLNTVSNLEKHPKDLEDRKTFENKSPLEKPNDVGNQEVNKNIKFMDSTIYTILINDNNNIVEVINRSRNSLSNDEIISLAREILEDKNIETNHIGFLYFDNFSYIYVEGNSLIILDNSEISHNLRISLEISILMIIILEIIIYVVSRIITNWITIPVKESFDKQKQFIADASHELKTPISVIIASSEVLEDNPTEVKWLKNIRNEANRMNLLVTELLELSASEIKEISKLKEGNLSKVVELAILTFEGKTYENNLKLDFKIEDNITMLMDENSIKQLIEILLDNAIKHSKTRTTIKVSLKLIDNKIELSVENEGKSIPKGEEEKIFERFYRVDKSRNRNENRYGLGLAIAKNIVENHKGKISASSSNGTTIFKVLFKK